MGDEEDKFVELRREEEKEGEGMKLKLGVTVAALRHAAASRYGWLATSVLIRRFEDGVLMKDNKEVLSKEQAFIASLRQWPVAATLLTAASLKAPCGDKDASLEVKMSLDDVGPITSFDFRQALAEKIGIPHYALVLHQVISKDVPTEDDGGGEGLEEEEPLAKAKEPPPALAKPPRPTTPENFEEDEGFEEVLLLRRMRFEALLCALDAADLLEAATASLAVGKAHAEQALVFESKEKPVEAREAATAARAAQQAVKRAVEGADKEASQAAMKLPTAERSLEAAKALVAGIAEQHTAAKQVARDVAKTTQQARIARKKVAEAIKAQKDAEEARDAVAAELKRRQASEDRARPLLPEALAFAQRASELAEKCHQAHAQAEEAAAAAEATARRAEETAEQRARAWKAEAVEFEKQGYGPPLLAQALRDLDVLQDLDVPCRRVLCRLRPRAARLFQEMASAPQLFGVMGSSVSSTTPVQPWSAGYSQTMALLRRPRPLENGDLLIRAESPFKWRAAMIGPRGSPYAGFFHWVSMDFGADWPEKPPELRFRTPIYHCNVGEDGFIRYAPLILLQERWTREDTVFPMLGALFELLCAPDVPTAIRPELAEKMTGDAEAFLDVAKAFTKEHGVPYGSMFPDGPPQWYK